MLKTIRFCPSDYTDNRLKGYGCGRANSSGSQQITAGFFRVADFLPTWSIRLRTIYDLAWPLNQNLYEVAGLCGRLVRHSVSHQPSLPFSPCRLIEIYIAYPPKHTRTRNETHAHTHLTLTLCTYQLLILTRTHSLLLTPADTRWHPHTRTYFTQPFFTLFSLRYFKDFVDFYSRVFLYCFWTWLRRPGTKRSTLNND